MRSLLCIILLVFTVNNSTWPTAAAAAQPEAVLLLDTLKQWRFFPAVRNGIAINSEFDVRIPIAVRQQ